MNTSTETMDALLLELNELIQNKIKSSLINQQVFVGFDGFIDTLQQAVQHYAGGNPVYFNTISDFANHLNQMNGKSGQVELVTKQVKLGGNAPILANAFGRLEVKCNCMGSMGAPDINSLFKSENPLVNMTSIAEPGKSSAIEFANGKIILSDLSTFKQYDWDYIKQKINPSILKKVVEPCRVIALVDWANLPRATSLWQGFLDDVIRPVGKKDQFFLFDLCDPSKKSSQQIEEVLDLISDFSNYGSVTLGINENEANKIWLALNGFHQGKAEIPNLRTVGYYIYRTLTIDTLLIHPTDRTLVFKNQKHLKKDSVIELKGYVVADPKLQTGAGDNLNAGYCLGLLAGLDIHHCMLLGMATSGAYVQNGRSPGLQDIQNYIENWRARVLEPVAA
jgi:hypothetical protein